MRGERKRETQVDGLGGGKRMGGVDKKRERNETTLLYYRLIYVTKGLLQPVHG